jgi:hypothetical protein
MSPVRATCFNKMCIKGRLLGEGGQGDEAEIHQEKRKSYIVGTQGLSQRAPGTFDTALRKGIKP